MKDIRTFNVNSGTHFQSFHVSLRHVGTHTLLAVKHLVHNGSTHRQHQKNKAAERYANDLCGGNVKACEGEGTKQLKYYII